MAKRRCKGKTKDGPPCRAWALQGSKPARCLAHSDAETRDSVGFTPEAGRRLGGRPRQPRVTEVMRERVEAEVESILRAYFDALDASRPMLVGKGKDRRVVEQVDHYFRLRAANALLDRVYGKPRQAHELSGPDGGPMRIAEDELADPETREALHELVRRVAAARTDGASGAGTGD